ncbi:hypothetical protein NLJ89_g7318 [Agrocybe chaxingu]|uniref:Uncharacterized protein n=1 Tax=Agrocybe chaxingu TaxID=84603 RepID=A0A9W8JWL3_9AGAR|nr:hypothetical protein NLJ89_g7318 [Agrocybe chaxingu]
MNRSRCRHDLEDYPHLTGLSEKIKGCKCFREKLDALPALEESVLRRAIDLYLNKAENLRISVSGRDEALIFMNLILEHRADAVTDRHALQIWERLTLLVAHAPLRDPSDILMEIRESIRVVSCLFGPAFMVKTAVKFFQEKMRSGQPLLQLSACVFIGALSEAEGEKSDRFTRLVGTLCQTIVAWTPSTLSSSLPDPYRAYGITFMLSCWAENSQLADVLLLHHSSLSNLIILWIDFLAGKEGNFNHMLLLSHFLSFASAFLRHIKAEIGPDLHRLTSSLTKIANREQKWSPVILIETLRILAAIITSDASLIYLVLAAGPVSFEPYRALILDLAIRDDARGSFDQPFRVICSLINASGVNCGTGIVLEACTEEQLYAVFPILIGHLREDTSPAPEDGDSLIDICLEYDESAQQETKLRAFALLAHLMNACAPRNFIDYYEDLFHLLLATSDSESPQIRDASAVALPLLGVVGSMVLGHEESTTSPVVRVIRELKGLIPSIGQGTRRLSSWSLSHELRSAHINDVLRILEGCPQSAVDTRNALCTMLLKVTRDWTADPPYLEDLNQSPAPHFFPMVHAVADLFVA